MTKSFYTSLILFTFTVLFQACGESEWDSEDQKALVKRCLAEGGSKSYCKCYLKNAMETYPDAEDMEDLDFESAVELSVDCP